MPCFHGNYMTINFILICPNGEKVHSLLVNYHFSFFIEPLKFIRFSSKSSIHIFLLFWTCILMLIFITFDCSFLFLFCSFFFHYFCPSVYFIQLKFHIKTRSIQVIAELRRQCAKTDSNQNFNLQIKSSVYVA